MPYGQFDKTRNLRCIYRCCEMYTCLYVTVRPLGPVYPDPLLLPHRHGNSSPWTSSLTVARPVAVVAGLLLACPARAAIAAERAVSLVS